MGKKPDRPDHIRREAKADRKPAEACGYCGKEGPLYPLGRIKVCKDCRRSSK